MKCKISIRFLNYTTGFRILPVYFVKFPPGLTEWKTRGSGGGNRFRAVHQLKEKMDTDEAYDLIARIRAYFEVPAALQGLKNLFDWFAGIDVSMDELTMAVQYLDADGAILYDKEYTYAELAAALDPAAVEPAAK